MPAAQFADEFHSCRACWLVNAHITGGPAVPNAAYQHDFEGADLTGATLTGDLSGYNFSGADLTGATFDHAVVDGTVFNQADLRGATLTGLQYHKPPSFAGVQIGAFNGKCTSFQRVDLVNASFMPVKPTAGCGSTPLLPGSRARLGLLYTIAHDDDAMGEVDFVGAQFVVDAGDRTKLAGIDLSHIDLDGARFVGFPVDFAQTNFDHAFLRKTSFALADLAGAKLADVRGAGAVFREANLSGASFAGSDTDLQRADFVSANVSRASFQGADLSGALFDDALAAGTDFNSVLAPNAVFRGAHIYGDGQAFDAARSLSGADFVGAVIAGNASQGGFDFTDVDLSDVKFDDAQCISCTFTGSTLAQATLAHAYLPGAVFTGVKSMSGVDLTDAWLYCGDLSNSACPPDTGAQGEWDWPLALGSQEDYGPVPFASTSLTGVSLQDVTGCPDGEPPGEAGCAGHLLPEPGHAPPLPAPCSAAALDACPTKTSTVYDASGVGAPISLAAATPPTMASDLNGRGYYAGFDDGTVRLVGDGAASVVAGRPGRHCPNATSACGDGGPGTQALLGQPAGLAVGLGGFLYVADPSLHRVRRIAPAAALSLEAAGSTLAGDPPGEITTVAGSGADCASQPDASCGDGGPATAAALTGPYGVWVNPLGDLFIADGTRGIREVFPDGSITTVGLPVGAYDVRSVVGGPHGRLYAATVNPDYLLKIDLASGEVIKAVGTGTSGYNGNQDSLDSLLPGPKVQINHPGSLAMTLDGDVLFADTDNNLIRAYVPSSGHVIDDIGGLIDNGRPQSGFNDDGHFADQTEFDHPDAVVATRGALFVVADTANKRIRQIGPTPLDEGLQGSEPAANPKPALCNAGHMKGRGCALNADH